MGCCENTLSMTLRVTNDLQGRLVRKLLDEEMSPGFREVAWDGRDEGGRAAASGVYFYELRAGKNTVTKKMVLLK